MAALSPSKMKPDALNDSKAFDVLEGDFQEVC